MNRRSFLSLSVGLLAARGLVRSQTDPSRAARLAGISNLFIVPFSHTDWAWTNSRQWMVKRHAQVLAEALDILRDHPDFRFYIETWNEQLDTFLQRFPERVEEMRSAVQSGRIGVAGAFANQHPGWMEPESLIRDMVLGRRLFREFAPGVNLDVMSHIDVTPGPSQMPQLLQKAGYRYYRIHRPEEGMNAQAVPRDFVWTGLDGTRMLTSRGFACGFMQAEPLSLDFDSRWTEVVDGFIEKEIANRLIPPAGSDALWLPFGCDDSRPLRSWHAVLEDGRWIEKRLPVEEFIAQWNEREPTTMAFGTPADFFHAIEGQNLPQRSGVIDATMWTYWYGLNGNRGLRLWRTRTDRMLTAAESFWSCAASLGDPYPETELESAWRELLSAYSHAQMWLLTADYESQLNRVRTSLASATRLRDTAMQAIASRISVQPPATGSSTVLFNELPWDRTEVVPVWVDLHDVSARNIVVRDARGTELPFQPIDVNWYETTKPRTIREANLLVRATVPALGYTTLSFEPADGELVLPDDGTHDPRLDTETALVQLSKRGVEFVLDKQTGVRYDRAGDVIFNVIEDTGPYHFGPVVDTCRLSDARITKLVRGPLRSSFTLEGSLGHHQLEITGHVYPESRRMALQVRVDAKRGNGHFMMLVGCPAQGRLSADVHFGVEERDVSKIVYEGQERLRKNVFYGAHWVDFSQGSGGVTLVGTTGEKGYQWMPEERLLGHFLLMTMTPGTEWERFVTPAREGTGLHEFDCHLLLHDGGWARGGVVRRANEAARPIIPVVIERPAVPKDRTLAQVQSFARLSPDNVQFSAYHQSASRRFLRVYESAGLASDVVITLAATPRAVQEVDFNGAPMPREISLVDRKIKLRMKPWEIVTLETVERGGTGVG
jgi:alpha-mannosidase